MALDYSYRLFFPSERAGEVLLAVVEQAEPSAFPGNGSHRVAIEGGSSVDLPFRRFPANVEGLPVLGQDRVLFATSLRFAPDDELRADADGVPARILDDGSISLGYIYLAVSRFSDELVEFEFTAATTEMSELFEESPAIEYQFLRLLEDHDGVCGLFDDEDKTDNFGFLLWPDPPDSKAEGLELRNALLRLPGRVADPAGTS